MHHKKLIERIKFLENEIKHRDGLIKILKKNCKIAESKKPEIIKYLNKLNSVDNIFFENGMLKFEIFTEIIREIDNAYLLIIDYNGKNALKTKSVLNFFMKRFSSVFSQDGEYIYGLVFFDELNRLKKIKKINYYNPEKDDFEETGIYKIVFKTERMDKENLEKAKRKFIEIRNKPSLKQLYYLEYSLLKNRLIDLEKELIESEKEKYRYIYDVSYPNLETKLKYEIDNMPFLFLLIERINNELNKIKDSRGHLMVVRRILKFVIDNCPYNNIIGLAQLANAKLED